MVLYQRNVCMVINCNVHRLYSGGGSVYICSACHNLSLRKYIICTRRSIRQLLKSVIRAVANMVSNRSCHKWQCLLSCVTFELTSMVGCRTDCRDSKHEK